MALNNGRVKQFKTHKGSTVKAEPFDGTFCLMARGPVTLRRYKEPREPGQFEDFHVVGSLARSGDMDVTLNKGWVWLYEGADGVQYVDWSPSILGYKEVEK